MKLLSKCFVQFFPSVKTEALAGVLQEVQGCANRPHDFCIFKTSVFPQDFCIITKHVSLGRIKKVEKNRGDKNNSMRFSFFKGAAMNIFKLLFITFIFMPLFSYSQDMIKIDATMGEKASDRFFLEGSKCPLFIDRSSLSEIMDEFIESSWDSGETLRVALPFSSVTYMCRGAIIDGSERDFEGELEEREEIREQKQQVNVARQPVPPRLIEAPRYVCGSSGYKALVRRAESFNDRARSAGSSGFMDVPSCVESDSYSDTREPGFYDDSDTREPSFYDDPGSEDTRFYCDSAEYTKAKVKHAEAMDDYNAWLKKKKADRAAGRNTTYEQMLRPVLPKCKNRGSGGSSSGSSGAR